MLLEGLGSGKERDGFLLLEMFGKVALIVYFLVFLLMLLLLLDL